MVFSRPDKIWQLCKSVQSQCPVEMLKRCPVGSDLELIVSLCLGSLHGVIIGVVFVS